MNAASSHRAPKLIRAVGHALKVLRDTEETESVIRIGELTGQRRYRALLRELAEDRELAALLRERPLIHEQSIDRAKLRALPTGSLGRAYVAHLDDHGLEVAPHLVATREIDDPAVAYLVSRTRCIHDIVHTLLGLGVLGHEEVLVHTFIYGQLRIPISGLIMYLGAAKHLVLEGRWRTLRQTWRDCYRQGQRARTLLTVPWEQLWAEPIQDLRRRFGIHVVMP